MWSDSSPTHEDSDSESTLSLLLCQDAHEHHDIERYVYIPTSPTTNAQGGSRKEASDPDSTSFLPPGKPAFVVFWAFQTHVREAERPIYENHGSRVTRRVIRLTGVLIRITDLIMSGSWIFVIFLVIQTHFCTQIYLRIRNTYNNTQQTITSFLKSSTRRSEAIHRPYRANHDDHSPDFGTEVCDDGPVNLICSHQLSNCFSFLTPNYKK